MKIDGFYVQASSAEDSIFVFFFAYLIYHSFRIDHIKGASHVLIAGQRRLLHMYISLVPSLVDCLLVRIRLILNWGFRLVYHSTSLLGLRHAVVISDISHGPRAKTWLHSVLRVVVLPSWTASGLNQVFSRSTSVVEKVHACFRKLIILVGINGFVFGLWVEVVKHKI